MVFAHRHPPAVPGVEIADDADPAGVGRPYRKGDALDPVMHDRMGAELLIAGEVVAFSEEMQVELAQHRRKPVDVVELVPMVAVPGAQPVAEGVVPPWH